MCATLAIEIGMKHTYTQLLTDDELRPHLEAKDTILFRNITIRWQHIERQVERLGFEERCWVSFTSGKDGDACKVVPK